MNGEAEVLRRAAFAFACFDKAQSLEVTQRGPGERLVRHTRRRRSVRHAAVLRCEQLFEDARADGGDVASTRGCADDGAGKDA